MENSNKSMAERLEALANAPKELDQMEAISKMDLESNGIGPETAGTNGDIAQGPGPCNVSVDTKGVETRPEGVIVDFERLLSDFRSHQDIEGKFRLLDGKYHLEIVSTSIQLFENRELLGVMFPGDKLDLDFRAQTAKVINYPYERR